MPNLLPVLLMALINVLLLSLTACTPATSTSSDTDLLLGPEHGGGGAAWGLVDCDACHAIGAIHKDEPGVRNIVIDKGYDSCTACHGSNGTIAPRQCLICHNENDLPVKPIQSGSHNHDFDASLDIVMQDEACINCHYASDMDGTFEINRDLTRYPDKDGINSPYANGTDFCLRCHNRDHQQTGFTISDAAYDNPLVAIEDTYTHVDKHGDIDSTGMRTYAGLRSNYSYGSRVVCTDCHVMHGTDNSKLIIDRSDKGSTKLDSMIRDAPYTVQVNGDDYSELCVLCHDMETVQNQGDVDTGNGLSGVHLTDSSCIECHSHGEAVQAGL